MGLFGFKEKIFHEYILESFQSCKKLHSITENSIEVTCEVSTYRTQFTFSPCFNLLVKGLWLQNDQLEPLSSLTTSYFSLRWKCSWFKVLQNVFSLRRRNSIWFTSKGKSENREGEDTPAETTGWYPVLSCVKETSKNQSRCEILKRRKKWGAFRHR